MNAHVFDTMTGGDGPIDGPNLLSLAALLALALLTAGVI